MRTIGIIISLFVYTTMTAQEYKSIIKDGRVWECTKIVHITYDGDKTIVEQPFTISVGEDIDLNGRTMKTLHCSYKKVEGILDGSEQEIYAYEEDGRTYQYFDWWTNPQSIAMLDFNDTGNLAQKNILSVDSIEIRGIKYKRINFNVTIDGTPISWVEGIGTNYGYWITPLDYTGEDYSYMDACYDNGILVFSREDFQKEALTSIRGISIKNYDTETLYSITGNMVPMPQKGNIYINNGRKFVKR